MSPCLNEPDFTRTVEIDPFFGSLYDSIITPFPDRAELDSSSLISDKREIDSKSSFIPSPFNADTSTERTSPP